MVDMPALSCRVRPFKPGAIPGRLVYDRDFQWPMAPTNDNGQADLRLVPTDNNYLDLASCQMDPKRKLAFVTALHLEKHLLFGYVFRQAGLSVADELDELHRRQPGRARHGVFHPAVRYFPPGDGGDESVVRHTHVSLAAGEGQTPDAVPDVLCEGPEGFSRIDDVVLEGGKLTIVDRSGKRLVLPASRGL